jgi:TonB-dependent starch-binding outer membrane protein SusC
MKKKSMGDIFPHIPSSFNKILRIMKLTLLLAVAISFQISATVLSQPISLDQKTNGQSIRSVLKLIEDESNFRFFYNDDFTQLNEIVKGNINNGSLDEVLGTLLADTELTYKLIENNFVVVFPNLQQLSITGIVTDASTGDPLPGVNIMIEGTMQGIVTDVNGKYSINVSSGNAVLLFSFIGYNTEKVEVNSRTSIDVSLVADITKLEEVVVVGYGTQKKVNLTGSVATVDAEELENRPITQTSQALAGLITGVSSLQGSGRPGNDASEIRIRGIGTFSSAGKDPLVLIDGLAASINDVDPNNIKSISVLKDAASAAIYGTRAANGVILIETKRGEKGKLRVNYNNYFGWQKVTELPDFLESWEYAKYLNQSNQNMGGGVVYTDEQIALFKNGSDPDNYPNVPHLKNLLNSGSGFQTNHNVNFMGGDEKNAYLFSLGYLSQDGVVDQNNYTRYNFGLNFDSQLRENLDLKLTMNGYSQNTEEPRSTGDMQNMIGFAVREAPIYAGRKSDGTYGYQDDFAPEAWMDSESFANRKAKNFMGGLELSWEFIKGLTLSGKAGYKYYNWTDQWFQSTFDFDASKTVGPNKLSVSSGDNSLLTLQSLLRYTKSLDRHNFTVLAGYSQELYREDWTTAFRDNFPNNSLYELNAGSGSNQQSSGSGLEWALRSYFGRVNYDFDGKYLFEANARYDGTSRFPKDGRWGLFPSVSIGWRLSEESFIKDNASWMDNLKLRASWGRLGNQNVGTYPYQNVLATGQNYTLNGALVSGVALTTLANSGVTWETTTVTDAGFDLSVFRNKLGVTFDYFNKTTSDILYKKSVSTVLGLNVNEYNAGEVKNKGFEIILDYRASIGDLNISVAPNFTYVKNEVTKLAEGKIQDIGQSLFIGESIGAIYGYEADGLFIDDNDVTNYPAQPIAGQPGVIRFKDISGPNGIPDGIVNATYDRKVIGSTTPKFYYGANITADFKGFDFSLLLQGMGGYQKLMGSYMAFAFYNSGQIQRWQADNAWTYENPDRNAVYPKLTSLNMGSENVQTNSFWLKNASFLRLKNIQIGYTIPKNITEKIKLTNLRVFVSGQNLFSFNHFYKGWDPEMYQATGDAPSFYPITSIYTLGLNVKF